MKSLFLAGTVLLVGAAIITGQNPVGALPPHPLDGAFEKATTVKGANEGLLNNEHYKKAVAEAFKAKQDVEKQRAATPNFAGPSPAQAARKKFLEILAGEGENKNEEKK